MKQREPAHIAQQLQDVPGGGLTIVRNSTSSQEYVLLTGQFSAKTVGKGKIEAYHIFPGVDASYNLLSAPEITVHHDASSSVLELFYCRNGRHSGLFGWRRSHRSQLRLLCGLGHDVSVGLCGGHFSFHRFAGPGSKLPGNSKRVRLGSSNHTKHLLR